MEMKEKKVYILSETYKDNDPDDIGAYDSKQALAIGFARHIASLVCDEVFGECCVPDQDCARRTASETADVVARLLPRLLDPEWDGTDECRYGKTVFGYREMTLESTHKETDNG